MTIIINSLTKLLDQRLLTVYDVDNFIDNLEDEVFGMSNRTFYNKYKGDIKELLESFPPVKDDYSYEAELLNAFITYRNQRDTIAS